MAQHSCNLASRWAQHSPKTGQPCCANIDPLTRILAFLQPRNLATLEHLQLWKRGNSGSLSPRPLQVWNLGAWNLEPWKPRPLAWNPQAWEPLKLEIFGLSKYGYAGPWNLRTRNPSSLKDLKSFEPWNLVKLKLGS